MPWEVGASSTATTGTYPYTYTYTFNGTITFNTWTTSGSNTLNNNNTNWALITPPGGFVNFPRLIQGPLVETQEERARSRTEATDRATALLMTLLDERQRETYRESETFEVIGSHGTLYRIHRGVSGNVEWITPEGEVGGRLCAHPSMHEHWLPTADVAIAQLLALTTDEAAFVRLAKVHRGRRPQLVAA